MAYFSNGSEGDSWESRNCQQCILGEEPCPVIGAHMIYNYDQIVDGKREGPLAGVLNILIPSDESGYAQDCPVRLMINKNKDKTPGQLSLFGED